MRPDEQFRSIAPRFRIDQVSDAFGRAEQLKLMTRFGWFFSGSRELDNIGVDGTWIKGATRIDIQLKCRNIDARDQSFSWKLCESGQLLNSDFYGQPQNYLCVIGFNEIGLLEDEFVPANIVHIGLVPAKVVYNNLHTNKLTISDRKLRRGTSPWSKFFGVDAIRNTLRDEMLNQLK